MRIITRYILREFLVPLFYCMGGFLSIYVLFELFGSFSRLSEAKIPFKTAVEYFIAYLAPFYEYLVPAALMLAALYTMWSFCRHSEIIAMRANGISFVTIASPILGAAAVMAASVWAVNDLYVPRKAQWARTMKSEKFDLAKLEKADNIVFRNTAAARTWTVTKLGAEDASRLLGVRVSLDRPENGARLLNVEATEAEHLDGEWVFKNPKIQHFNEKGQEIASPTPELDALPLRTFKEFNELPKDFLMQNRDWAYNSIADGLRYLRTHPDISEKIRRKYRYDTWAKVFAPLACIIITLFAIPAGIASGRQSVFKGILGALGLYFSYYGLTILCKILADCTPLPPLLAAALPCLVFLILGVRAFRKHA